MFQCVRFSCSWGETIGGGSSVGKNSKGKHVLQALQAFLQGKKSTRENASGTSNEIKEKKHRRSSPVYLDSGGGREGGKRCEYSGKEDKLGG